jgi:eukaryotic-like serine/threonine-protein kinase
MSVEAGQKVSHYKILEKLGEGGMGTVFKALDLSLNRFVALKFLPAHLMKDEATRKCFISEAQTASALDNTHICTIHEINTTQDAILYISMAYYNGESLSQKLKKGPLPFDEAIWIFQKIVDGIHAAHQENIIHRDIKPANIIITNKNEVKIVDFGLAKLAGETFTETSTIGTVAYLAPEAIRGLPEDHRADIWSLGVLLFEMVTGHLPFHEKYREPMMYSIVNQEPPALSNYLDNVPESLQDLINKLLKKDPAERYQSVSNIFADIEKLRLQKGFDDSDIKVVRNPSFSQKKIFLYSISAFLIIIAFLTIRPDLLLKPEKADLILVLEHKSMTNDLNQEWFSDGITDALTTKMAQISGMRVISRSTAMKYKDTEKTPPEIAAELGVQYLLEISTIELTDQIQISARLINAPEDEYIWAKTYNHPLKDILFLLGSITQDIADKIETELTSQERERFTQVRPVNPKAFELYLKGNYHFNKYTKPDILKATDYFQKAIKADSGFALPYAGLIYCYGFFTYFGEIPRDVGIAKIRESINKALERDEYLAEAYQGLAAYRFHQEWDWSGTGEAFERALKLNPNLSGLFGTEYAWYLILMGYKTEAIIETKRLLHVDPLSYATRMTANYVYYCSGQYEEAIELCRRTIELEPEISTTYENLARNYEQLNMYDEAHDTRLTGLKIAGVTHKEISEFDSLYDELGSKAYPMWMLLHQQKLSSWSKLNLCDSAWIYTRLGDQEKALSLLELAYQKKDGDLNKLKMDPQWDPLREKSRFQNLLNRMKFPN